MDNERSISIIKKHIERHKEMLDRATGDGSFTAKAVWHAKLQTLENLLKDLVNEQ